MLPVVAMRVARTRFVGGLSLVFLSCFALSRTAEADVPLAKVDNWELFTNGRVNGFFSYGQGDANPLERTLPDGRTEHIPLGGGLDVSYDNIAKLDANGMALPVQGTFKSMRLRSGFVPNVLGFGLKRSLNENTTLKIYTSFWGSIETEAQRKTAPNITSFQEGYMRVDAPWGIVVVGRSLSLFSRGATETDFMYGHGYGLGYPGNIHTNGPTAGLIGFGVLAAFFSPGIVYATPQVGGLQLWMGVYDPTPLPGNYESTRWARPEAELTYDFKTTGFKAHLFGNGAYQKLYNPGTEVSGTMYGAGYDDRFEFGPVHIGASGHYGKGLGLGYSLQGGSVSVGPSPENELRNFDGYSVLAQFVAGQFDFNLGWGMSRTYQLQSDKDDGSISVLKNQQAYTAVIVYHVTDNIHLALDYIHGDAKWFLGEEQKFDFLSTGATATW
jgi:hypothetical protein